MTSPSDESEPTADGWAFPATLFHVDEIVGGRYRVLRFVGQGAMGEVYAADDLDLGSRVALKVLRTGVYPNREGVERFKREILLARRVSHPNVCRIYDLGVHPSPAAAGVRPLLFLTMELVEGRTLVDRLTAAGPYSESEAAPIVIQLADALAAAHAAGVVHRDFKSSNILLVDAPEGVRAVVTDFGLAREQTGGDSARLTATGGVLGTPAYMAPEQVEGQSADARSDLYAFGVVLYEMLTGRLPFEGESPLSIAVKRLREPPTPAESHRPDLSPRARAVLERCLARDPAGRFADAREIARAFTGDATLRLPPSPRGRRRWAAAAALATATVAGTLGWLATRPPAGAPAALRREAIAVLPLRNATGRADSAWLSTALAEMLTTELAAGASLRAIPGETVATAVRDLGLSPGEALGADNLTRLRRGLGADLVLAGSYVGLGEAGGQRLRIDLRLQRTAGGSDPPPRRIEGEEGDLFGLVGRAGAELRSDLGLPPPAATERTSLHAALPRDGEAIRLYAQGLELLRGGEPLEARARFEAALAEEPEAPLVWSALSEAWTMLGWSDRALDAAREAFERRETLPRVEASIVEGRYRLAAGDWPAAVEIQRALWRLFRDDPEHGLRLVQSLLEADRARDALEVVAELRALPPPANDDPRIDLYEARAADGVSELRRQLDAAERAEAKARAAGSRSLVARALYEQGLARRRLGEPDASRAALTESRRIAAEVGDRNGVAMALLSLANVVRAGGELDEAAALYAEARATFAAIGNRQREARAELSQGLVVSQQGDLAGALALYGSALEKMREVGDRRGAAVALSNIGTQLYERGDLAGALARHEEAMAEFRALGDDSRLIVSLQNLAQIRQDRGELDAAERALGEELALARRIEDRTGEGYALKGLADLLAERGELDAADERYDEAIAVFEAAGQQTWRWYAEMGRALVARERGLAAESATRLAALSEEFARAGMDEDRDEASIQLVRSRVAAGDAEGAAAVGGALLERASRSEVRRLRHLARLASGELDAARGSLDRAASTLVEEERASRAAGQVLYALEARAGLALVERRRGSAGAERIAAAALAEAERLGAGRIAARLRAAR